MKKMAIININKHQLKGLLRLPADAEIVEMKYNFCSDGLLSIKLEGVGMDTAPGMSICQYNICNKIEEDHYVIDWELTFSER